MTIIQYRQRATGMLSLVNIAMVRGIISVEHGTEWAVHFTISMPLIDDSSKSPIPTLVSGLDRETANRVVRLIGVAVRDNVPMVDIDDVVAIAERPGFSVGGDVRSSRS